MAGGVAQGRVGEAKPVGQDLIIAILALGFTTYYFWTVQELAWEAKSNGIVIGGALCVLVGLLVLRIAVRVWSGEASLRMTLGGDPQTDRLRLGLLGISVAFLLLLPFAGTSIALALMLFATMWMLGARHWPTLLGVSLITPLLVWASLVVGLGTRFPAGPFERLMASLLGLGGAD